MDWIIKTIIIFFMLFGVGCSHTNISEAETCASEENTEHENHISNEECRRLKEYCIKKGLNSEICILVDFSEFSGDERLYIYNLDNNYIEDSGWMHRSITTQFIDMKTTHSFRSKTTQKG